MTAMIKYVSPPKQTQKRLLMKNEGKKVSTRNGGIKKAEGSKA